MLGLLTKLTQLIPTNHLSSVCLNKKADIVFALDSSNQISTQDFWNQIRFVREFAKNLDIGPNKTRVGLIVYTDQVLEGFELNTYQDVHDVTTGLLAVERSAGGTRIGEAVRYIRTKSFRRSLARRNVAQIGVILAASQSYNIGRTKKEADMARKSGIKLFAIGAGKTSFYIELIFICVCYTWFSEIFLSSYAIKLSVVLGTRCKSMIADWIP